MTWTMLNFLKKHFFEINPSVAFKHYQDPKAGLNYFLEKGSDLPDLIFLDINMPIMSGWQCLTEFKKAGHLKHIPVIMFTTSSQPKEKELAKELGAQDFIIKPSEYKALKQLIFDAINNQ